MLDRKISGLRRWVFFSASRNQLFSQDLISHFREKNQKNLREVIKKHLIFIKYEVMTSMEREINQLVEDYESGHMTRRQLVAKLGAFIAVLGGAGHILRTGEANAQQPATPSTFEATELNHIALRVTDVQRSRDFYMQHLGLTIARESTGSCFLNCGSNFVALFRGDNPEMDHYCYSIENFEVRGAEERLKSAGLKPRVHGNSRIYFDDPDGLTVQLASDGHRP
jgi:catechol 2,3-dioxygenase-like lactoylglutathione lyase family enzyme